MMLLGANALDSSNLRATELFEVDAAPRTSILLKIQGQPLHECVLPTSTKQSGYPNG
jgi:hypothetical protein